jgi:hypothetical protein
MSDDDDWDDVGDGLGDMFAGEGSWGFKLAIVVIAIAIVGLMHACVSCATFDMHVDRATPLEYHPQPNGFCSDAPDRANERVLPAESPETPATVETSQDISSDRR